MLYDFIFIKIFLIKRILKYYYKNLKYYINIQLKILQINNN